MEHSEETLVDSKKKLNVRQSKILGVLSTVNNDLSITEIYDRLDAIGSIRTIKTDLFTLKKFGLVERSGSGKLFLWKKSP